MDTQEPETGPGCGNWLKEKLRTLEALYQRFGREGLKDASFADVSLLLSSKELLLRDAAKSSDLGEQQKAENRHLEMEIKDLTAYIQGSVGKMSLSDLRYYGRSHHQEQGRSYKGKEPYRGRDR